MASLILLGLGLCVGAAPGSRASGIVIEEIADGSSAQKAGLQAGDVIVAWSRAANPPFNPNPARGRIDSVFDVVDVEAEQAPRGHVTLHGTRGEAPLALTLPPGGWQLTARPPMPPEVLRLYRDGREQLAGGRAEVAAARWRQAAAAALAANDGSLACWLWHVMGDLAAAAKRGQEAEEAYAQAARLAPTPAVRAAIQERRGHLLRDLGSYPEAEAAFAEAVRLRESTDPGSLLVARALSERGWTFWLRGDVSAAAETFRRALAIVDGVAPSSLLASGILRRLAWPLNALSGPENQEAESLARRALEIAERIAPDSEEVAGSLRAIGGVVWARGDLPAAERYWRRALAIRERREADRPDLLADSLNLVGIVAGERGDLTEASRLFRRALELRERSGDRGDRGRDMARLLHNLGYLAQLRGDMAVAEDYYRSGLAAMERMAPESQLSANLLKDLAAVAAGRSDLAEAEAYLAKAMAIQEKASPRGKQSALVLLTMADFARRRGAWDEAEARARRSLALLEHVAAEARP